MVSKIPCVKSRYKSGFMLYTVLSLLNRMLLKLRPAIDDVKGKGQTEESLHLKLLTVYCSSCCFSNKDIRHPPN